MKKTPSILLTLVSGLSLHLAQAQSQEYDDVYYNSKRDTLPRAYPAPVPPPQVYYRPYYFDYWTLYPNLYFQYYPQFYPGYYSWYGNGNYGWRGGYDRHPYNHYCGPRGPHGYHGPSRGPGQTYHGPRPMPLQGSSMRQGFGHSSHSRGASS